MTKIVNSDGLYKPKNKPNKAPPDTSPLDTLAQLGTKHQNEADLHLKSCTCEQDKPTLIKRARRKFLGHGLALRLVDASKNNDASTLQKAYFNTYHCVGTLEVKHDGKVVGKYCKNRWCMVCNSIRTAKLIKQYKPVLDSWDDKYFVTLTVRNCIGLDLENTLGGMAATIRQIKDTFRKRHQRGKGEKFVGLRKLECTYNPRRNDYHPHYHLIVRGKDTAKEIVDLWLEKMGGTKRKCQDFKPADDNSCMELFKYFTKVISKTRKGNREIYADAMDVIFNAIKGKRTFQTFGFKMPKLQDDDGVKEDEMLLPEDVKAVLTWNQDHGDWIDIDTGELFTGYRPSDGMRDLVETIQVRPYFKQYNEFVESG